MLINLLFSDPIYFFVAVAVIVIALSFHEFAHAVAGTLLGDPTAKDEGRLTLNPLAHLSFLGSLFLLFVGFGWGKPVPINSYNLKYQRFGTAIVALAGPVSNLILAIIFGICLKIISLKNLFPADNLLILFLYYSVVLNINLMLFNLLPFAPLDGSKLVFAIFYDYKYAKLRQILETQGTLFLLTLVFLDSFTGLNIFGFIFSGVENLVNRLVF